MILFTVEEAEAMLPQVREELLAMRTQKQELDELRTEVEQVTRTTSGNGHVRDEEGVTQKRRRAEALVEQINAGIARINGRGIELKGLDEGLIDFPSEREGRVVYLCWRFGDEHIGWWHETDTGFAGRHPL